MGKDSAIFEPVAGRAVIKGVIYTDAGTGRKAETDGKTLYEKLKERGILVRRFGGGRINNFVRITVGNEEQIDALLKAVKEIIK